MAGEEIAEVELSTEDEPVTEEEMEGEGGKTGPAKFFTLGDVLALL